MNKILIAILLFCTINLFSQNKNFQYLKIKIENYNFENTYLSIRTGEDYKSSGVFKINMDGYYYIKLNDSIKEGVYYLGATPNEYTISFLIDPAEGSRNFIFDYQSEDKFISTNSPSNLIYNDYLKKISFYKYKWNEPDIKLKDSVIITRNKIRNLFLKKPLNKLTDLLIKSEIEWKDTVNPNINRQVLNDLITQNRINHFIDNIEVGNDISLHLPQVYNIINEYFERGLHVNHKLVIPKLDSLFLTMGFDSEMFKYYLPKFEKKYSFTFQPWVDTVYSHIAKKYYNKELCPWMDSVEIERVNLEAIKKESTLIGKPMPEITLFNEDGKSVNLSDINAKFIVLDFWRPGCGHCTDAMPLIESAAEKLKDKGVVVVAMCTRQGTDAKMCYDYFADKKHDYLLYNLADPKGNANLLTKFNITGVPMIYIVDENKTIVDKKVAPSMLYYRLIELLENK